ncbi:MAG: ACT domain-containing protein, partial [Gemmatimonadales bacterium]
GASPVSVINSMSLAHDRGIRVERRVGHSHEDFETTLGVTVTTTVRSTTVVGAMVGEQGRIVRIDDFKVDFVPEGHVIIPRNHDVPGVIGRVGSLLGESNINIASYHQSRHDGGGEAIAAIAVDHEANEDLVKRLCALSDVIDVRQVSLGT